MSENHAPLFSIVIVTFNNAPHIVPCLQSLVREFESFDHEVILIDNHSSDDTINQVKPFIKNVSNSHAWTFIKNSVNVGFTKALNQGLKKCKGRYILVLNPDTRVTPGSIKILLGILEQDSSVGVVAPQLIYPDGKVQPSCRRFPKHRDIVFEILGLSRLFKTSALFNGWKMGDFDHSARKSVDQPQGACLLFRRKLLEEAGYWDEAFPMFFSDVDWCLRVKQHGWQIVFEPRAKVIHYKGASIYQKRPAMIWNSHISFYRYLKKHRPNPLLNTVLGLLLIITAIFRSFWTRVQALLWRDHGIQYKY